MVDKSGHNNDIKTRQSLWVFGKSDFNILKKILNSSICYIFLSKQNKKKH